MKDEQNKERYRGYATVSPYGIEIKKVLMRINSGWPAYLRNTRNIGDFRQWKDHNSYQKAFDRLLRDLKGEEKRA